MGIAARYYLDDAGNLVRHNASSPTPETVPAQERERVGTVRVAEVTAEAIVETPAGDFTVSPGDVIVVDDGEIELLTAARKDARMRARTVPAPVGR